LATSGAGIGLNNVRERLALRFGPRAGLEARAATSGFVVALRIPLEFG
jgi:LytS/YehU family sensor histidine kinase